MTNDRTAGTTPLSMRDSGRAIALLLGEKLHITLPSNPATGYCWTITAVDRQVLGFSGHAFSRELPPPATSTGGHEAWELAALAPGRAALRLEYRRPWEDGAAHAAFTLMVTVLPGSALVDPKANLHPDGYFALVLSEASSRALKERFATLPRRYAHHCTVRYGSQDPADLPPRFTAADLGRTFTLKVIGHKTRADNGIQAAAVALVGEDGALVREGFSSNKVAHITVATNGVVSAVESNALLEEGFTGMDGDGPELEATLVHTWLTGEE
ncbi:protease inhibitor I42 family protein [Sorangium sp. So ce131]|uniref:protease inhibitor I42 family protein n=1 Tax=Sorangium sp. So ce131 TaxID=3133282 RepID=UPI003F645F4E